MTQEKNNYVPEERRYMKNLIIGIIIGIVLILSVKTVLADGQSWKLNFVTVDKFTDGPHINCYVAQNEASWNTGAISSISCIYVK